MLVLITDGDDQSHYDGLRERLEVGGIDLFVISINSDNPELKKLAMGYVWVPQLSDCVLEVMANHGIDQSAPLVKELKQTISTFVTTAMFRHR